jgi:hypothetical protein
MDYLFQDIGKPKKVGRPKGSKNEKNDKKTKTSSETKTSKKPKSKTGIKPKKGGNFLGSIGELVAPTGWESFASAAALLAIDRADAALRRFKKRMSGGHWGTRKQLFNKDMKKLKIEYDESDKKWKRKGEVVIDCSNYRVRYPENKRPEFSGCNFPSLAIVIDSLSKFFDIPIIYEYKEGEYFSGNVFYTSDNVRKIIYNKMYDDVYKKLESEKNL